MLARLLLHCVGAAQRIGNVGGGGLLDQSVLTRPEAVSWNAISPRLTGAAGSFPCSSVVQESVNWSPFWSLTVTFSLVGVVL